MLTEYEARKLQDDFSWELDEPAKQRVSRDMRDEPSWRLDVAIRSGVCLLILVGLAVIGATSDLPSGDSLSALEDEESAQYRERGAIELKTNVIIEIDPNAVSKQAEKAADDYAIVSAEQHRKAVFDERRRAWEQRQYHHAEKVASGKDAP